VFAEGGTMFFNAKLNNGDTIGRSFFSFDATYRCHISIVAPFLRGSPIHQLS